MAESIVLERLLSPQPDTVASGLKRQRVYILPTRPGFLYCIALFTMLLGAINYSNSMAYILTFLLGSVYLVCLLHTYRNLAGLVINDGIPKPVFAGETALFPLIIDNRHGQARFALQFMLHPSPKEIHGIKPVTTNLQDNEWQRVEIPASASKRGLFSAGRVMIFTCFPLGLFRAWSYIHLGEKCVVYPGPEGIDQFPEPVSAEEQGLEGTRPGTNDFDGFRQYHPGDSIRNIAWKAVAREQPLLVKRFSGEGGHTLMLTWEDVSHLQDTELRLSQLCRWILLAEKQDWACGMNIPGCRIEPAQGILHRNRCLEALARFGTDHAA
jgi:uncharacterized protein (DUF58 family)